MSGSHGGASLVGAGPRPLQPLPIAGACGAIGRFDAGRVERMAALCGAAVRRVHRDRRSVLWLDREPIAWEGREARGLAWSESPRPPRGRPARWTEAARDLDACGLVLEGRRRLVHSSASGIAPVYWMDEGDATYFCSRVDPLVQTAAGRLAPDWTAWASILRIGYPPVARTTFDEIRRLEHSSSLERGPGGGVARVGRWPWAEEELIAAPEAVEGVVAALAAELDSLAGRRIVLGLSGGADSRLLLAGLCAGGYSPETVTLPGVWGLDDDERLAEEAAAAAGVSHEVLPAARAGYWRDAESVAEASDYQQALEWAWLAPLVRRLAAEPGAVAVDGLAGDILIRGKQVTPESLRAVDATELGDLLWRFLAAARGGQGLLRRQAERAITAHARREIDALAADLHGHPAALTLAIYRLRTTRGMAGGATALGRALPTVTPFVAGAVAHAALRCPPAAKLGGAFHRDVIARLRPELAAIPVNSFGPAPPPARVPERRRESEALEGFRDLLRESPFRRWFRGTLREAVEAGPAARVEELRPHRLVNGYAHHVLWLRRYSDRLRNTSPRALLE